MSLTPLPLHIQTTADVIEMIPFTLGFVPSDDIIITGLKGNKPGLAARVNIEPVTIQSATRTAAGIMKSAARNGVTAAVITIWLNDRAQAQELTAMLRQDTDYKTAADAHPAWAALLYFALCELAQENDIIIEALAVINDDQVIILFPGDGTPEWQPLQHGRVTDYFLKIGRTAKTESEVGAELLPDSTAMSAETFSELTQDEPHEVTDPATAAAHIMASAELYAQDARALPDDLDLAKYGLWLRDTAVRDVMWMAIDDAELDANALMALMTRTLPAPYAGNPAFLYGWSAWRAGNGLLARIATERAIADDPTSTAGPLLLAVLNANASPRDMPPLRGNVARVLTAANEPSGEEPEVTEAKQVNAAVKPGRDSDQP